MITTTADDATLVAALEDANIPTLLLVNTWLSSDPRYLSGPFTPSRTIAMDDNDDGGLAPQAREQVRAETLRLVASVRDGHTTLPPAPSGEELIDWLSASLGEQVPAEYAESMLSEAGFATASVDQVAPFANSCSVVVIGAGVSGICMAAGLRRAGVACTVIERNSDVGGTWLENVYPGAGVDTPSHLYSFSFAPRSSWSRYYAAQPEILDYLRDVAREEGVLERTRFDTSVEEAVWDATTSTWEVVLTRPDGQRETIRADVVISSVGQFNQPALPDIPGLERFRGPSFHTARWDPSVDVDDLRVGIIGSGASSIQVLPAICEQARSTTVFQRSPQWISPNRNYRRAVAPDVQTVMSQVPGYREWYRLRLMWMFQDKLHPTLQKDPAWSEPQRSINAVNEKHRAFFVRYLHEQLDGRPDLIEKTLPGYPPYGKRMCLDSGWLQSLRRDDVELVTTAIREVDETGVVTTDGVHHDLDVLALATGFTARRLLHPIHVVGSTGRSLREVWGDDDAWAYLGVAVPEFPNFFMMYGPNTGLGHGGSTMFMAECETRYIIGLLREMVGADVAAVEVDPEVMERFRAEVDDAHHQMIWTHPGMTTYYRNAAGRIVTHSPFRLVDYWAMTKDPTLDDYVTRGPRAGAEAPPAGS